ncbi:MAG: biotin/lipoyl-containing protein, partial [Alphaproteobacteria bacterium]
FRGIVNDRNVSVKIEHFAGGYHLTHAGRTVEVTIRSPRVAELEKFMPKKENNKKTKFLNAPIAGMVVAVKVQEGEEVKIGQEIIIIEAMKMENVIYAEHESKIASISVKQGDNVSHGQVIIEFE